MRIGSWCRSNRRSTHKKSEEMRFLAGQGPCFSSCSTRRWRRKMNMPFHLSRRPMTGNFKSSPCENLYHHSLPFLLSCIMKSQEPGQPASIFVCGQRGRKERGALAKSTSQVTYGHLWPLVCSSVGLCCPQALRPLLIQLLGIRAEASSLLTRGCLIPKKDL